MPKFPVFEYTNSQVLKAGKALRGQLLLTPESEPQILEIFRIANSWRDSHAYPMRSVRQEMIAKMRQLKLEGIAVARLKRMRSIRRKLRTISVNLSQIQDLGGCRAVLPSIGDTRALMEAMREQDRHALIREDPYIDHPKPGGYRSHHLVFAFRGMDDEAPYSGRRIELQIRTRLQHSWATAVEAVGLFRRENMKAGEGNPDWLRLFELMSAELALAEQCPEPPCLPPRDDRVKEIEALDKKLQAASTLQNLRNAVRYTEGSQNPNERRPPYYRIEYDNETSIVQVRGHWAPIPAIFELEEAEKRDNMHEENKINTVFVEANRIEDLRDAYPNYFGDVSLFTTNLTRITEGREAQEYTMPPRRTPPPRRRRPEGNLMWLKPGRHRHWD